MQVVPSVCTFCGVGCGLGLRVEGGRVIGVEPQAGHPVSQGQLCAKGWASGFAVDPGDRLRKPLIKAHGRFREASWDEALTLVAGEMRAALETAGPAAVGVISCAHATNEDNYAAQKPASRRKPAATTPAPARASACSASGITSSARPLPSASAAMAAWVAAAAMRSAPEASACTR
jgi:formate dehydrogenase major subunit